MRAAKIGKIGGGDRRRSRWQAVGLWLCAINFWTAIALGQVASPQESAKSVVKITSRFADGKVESGSGFVWSQPAYVVTALHLVAGSRSIAVYSESLKKEREAEIIAVHKESDLALLQLKTADLNLPPLKIASAAPNMKEEHYIWGYPRDVNSMQGDDIRFSLSLEQQPTLANIFKSQAQFEKTVGDQGYPQYQAKILRVSSSIQPGHSGAPIFNKTGMVVGVGDGGLHQGIARINWAIPAYIYLPGLPASKDPKPTDPSKQVNLYSATVENPITVRAGQEGSRQEEVLHLVWSAPLHEILATAADESEEDFQALSADIGEPMTNDVEQAIISVYEDYETGATIAVPQGVSLRYDKATRMLRATSANQRVEMIVQIVPGATWQAGVEAKDAFDTYIESLDGEATWEEDPEMPDEEPEYDQQEAYWSWDKSRIVTEDGETRSRLYATLNIDDNDFLGTAVFVRDLLALSPEDEQLFYLMLACVELADFAIE